jgi:hypothetical protein
MRPVNRLRREAALTRVLAQGNGDEAVLRPCVCLRCGNFWWPRGLQSPQRCAKCKTPYWNRPRQEKKKVLRRPYFLRRPHKEEREAVRKQLVESLGTVGLKGDAQEDRSLSKALEVLKDMKAAGRTWAEMAERVQKDFGTQLDKDQLKALIR